MPDHLAVLERILADHLGVLNDHVPDFEKRALTEETAALSAAIALMRGQSEVSELPPELGEPEGHIFHSTEAWRLAREFNKGWNSCRQAMADYNEAVRKEQEPAE